MGRKQEDILTQLYLSAAKAAKVTRLTVVPMSQEEIKRLGTPSQEAWKRYEESESEQTEAWMEIRSLPLGR